MDIFIRQALFGYVTAAINCGSAASRLPNPKTPVPQDLPEESVEFRTIGEDDYEYVHGLDISNQKHCRLGRYLYERVAQYDKKAAVDAVCKVVNHAFHYLSLNPISTTAAKVVFVVGGINQLISYGIK